MLNTLKSMSNSEKVKSLANLGDSRPYYGTCIMSVKLISMFSDCAALMIEDQQLKHHRNLIKKAFSSQDNEVIELKYSVFNLKLLFITGKLCYNTYLHVCFGLQ